MARRLFYAPEALDDLAAAGLWLTQAGSGPVARRKLLGIWAALEGLVQAPCRHKFGPEPGVREVLCPGGYRAVYRVTPDTNSNETAGDVQVLRVFGPGQDRSG